MGLLEPLLDVGPRLRCLRIFPWQSVAAAKIVARASELEPKYLAEEAAAAVIAGSNDRPMWQRGDALAQFLAWGWPDGKIDRAGQVIGVELARIAHVHEDCALLLHRFVYVGGCQQDFLIAIRRNGAQVGERPRLQSGQRAPLDQPLFQAADHETAIDAFGCKRVTGFITAVAIVAEQD